MKSGLFVNHKKEGCGIYQYGKNIYHAICNLQDTIIDYIECDDRGQLKAMIESGRPDFVIYNYDPFVLPFIDKSFLKSLPNSIHICLAHELSAKEIKQIDGSVFDYYLFADPSCTEQNPRFFKLNRLLFSYTNLFPLPEIPTIGSSGMIITNKGYRELVNLVQEEFDEALIRINISKSSFFDLDGKHIQELHALIKKPGIKLEVTHHFFTQAELLDFLAQNTINVFLYTPYWPYNIKGGVSSAIDQAISVKRPIAVSLSPFFRHLITLEPQVIVKYNKTRSLLYGLYLHASRLLKRPDVVLKSAIHLLKWHLRFQKHTPLSLRKIIENGTKPLEPFYTAWSVENFQANFQEALNGIFEKEKSKITSFLS